MGIAQLILLMLGITERIVVEGGKIIATMRQDLTIEELEEAIKKSKSINWPELTFKRE